MVRFLLVFAFMKLFEKLFGKKDDAPSEDRRPIDPREKIKEKAVAEVVAGARRSVRESLSPEVFSAKAMERKNHRSTNDRLHARMVTDTMLDRDEKFQQTPNVVKEKLKEAIFELLSSARKNPAVFYDRLDAVKNSFGGNETLRDIFLTSFSTWLMQKTFEYDPSDRLNKKFDKPYPRWIVLGCNHTELLGVKPRVRACHDRNPAEFVELIDVFYGLKLL